MTGEGHVDFGQNDIFATVMKKPEHPGRVRSIGFGVSQRSYFQSKSQPTNQILRDEIADLKKLVNSINERLMSMPPGQFPPSVPTPVPLASGQDSHSVKNFPQVNIHIF